MEVVVAGMEYVPAILVLWEELAEYHERLSPFYERCEGALGNFDTSIRQCIESPNSLVFVCLDQGQVIGYANCSIELHPPVIACREYGFIVEMVVARNHRRRGAATLLFRHALDWFASRGIDRVELNVSDENEAAMRFWSSQGFEGFQRLLWRRVP
jgi:GNAT superfamily N-acetyltransferase